jgi:glycosyltransferase involved in cell wall biosynthesis
MQRAGMLVGIFATKPGDAVAQHPSVAALDPLVHHLSDGTPEEQAAEVLRLLAGSQVDGVHGYFAHRPAAVARVAAGLLGVGFGFSVHAKDPRKVEPAELADRARAAACIVACNGDVAEQLRAAGADPILVPHGVDLASFAPTGAAAPPRSSDRDEPSTVELLAVGRLVEKKGFVHLLEAGARLSFEWRLRFVGEGPLEDDLRAAAGRLGIADRVEFVGSRTHAELPSLYRSAHLVVVPSVVDSQGDRDGLPNVVLEAMASGVPIVASDVAAIPSAIVHGETGLLVAPHDVAGLAAAIERLVADPSLATQLAARARRRVEDQFGLPACTHRFLSILENAYA